MTKKKKQKKPRGNKINKELLKEIEEDLNRQTDAINMIKDEMLNEEKRKKNAEAYKKFLDDATKNLLIPSVLRSIDQENTKVGGTHGVPPNVEIRQSGTHGVPLEVEKQQSGAHGVPSKEESGTHGVPSKNQDGAHSVPSNIEQVNVGQKQLYVSIDAIFDFMKTLSLFNFTNAEKTVILLLYLKEYSTKHKHMSSRSFADEFSFSRTLYRKINKKSSEFGINKDKNYFVKYIIEKEQDELLDGTHGVPSKNQDGTHSVPRIDISTYKYLIDRLIDRRKEKALEEGRKINERPIFDYKEFSSDILLLSMFVMSLKLKNAYRSIIPRAYIATRKHDLYSVLQIIIGLEQRRDKIRNWYTYCHKAFSDDSIEKLYLTYEMKNNISEMLSKLMPMLQNDPLNVNVQTKFRFLKAIGETPFTYGYELEYDIDIIDEMIIAVFDKLFEMHNNCVELIEKIQEGK